MGRSTQLGAREITYMRTQKLGRFATVDPSGAPQNNPVTFEIDEGRGVIEIRGHALSDSRKWRNLAENRHVAFVVDDVAPGEQWAPRMVEVRGTAERITGDDGGPAWSSGELIRVWPATVFSFGIDAFGAFGAPGDADAEGRGE